MTQKLLKISFTLLASPAGSSKETANPQKAVTVIRHQGLPLVSLGVQFASVIDAASYKLQGEWQNLSLSSAAQGLKDAQHPFSESLCSESLASRVNSSLLHKAVLESQNYRKC